MASIGRIKEFREDKEDWDQYMERLDHFFSANGITVADKKRSVFLTVIGAKTYKRLRSLIAPTKPRETSYEDLMTATYEKIVDSSTIRDSTALQV